MKIGTGMIEAGTFEADAAIDISAGRSSEFVKQARVLSDYIKALPLDHQQNDCLIAEITKHMIMAETDAFKYGLSMGVELGKSLESDMGDYFDGVKGDA